MSDALDTALEAFKAKVESFLAHSGMAISRFGRLACGDGDFVSDLRKGMRQFRPSTIRKVEKFMDEFPERDPAQGNASGAGDPSEASTKSARRDTGRPQREKAA